MTMIYFFSPLEFSSIALFLFRFVFSSRIDSLSSIQSIERIENELIAVVFFETIVHTRQCIVNDGLFE